MKRSMTMKISKEQFEQIMQHEVKFNLMMYDRMKTDKYYPDISKEKRIQFQQIFMHHAQIAAASLNDPELVKTLAESCKATAKWLDPSIDTTKNVI
jgi:hypothetical protein